MPTKPLHIPALTGIRAFAALWVVLLHFRANTGIHEIINFDWLASRGFWGVDFFFVLSGFILTHTYWQSLTKANNWTSYKLFLIKRFARLYPLHLVTLALFAGLLGLGSIIGQSFVVPERCTVESLLPNLLMIHSWGVTDSLSWNYPSWSISAEWFAYLFVFALFVFRIAKKNSKLGIRLVIYSWLALCSYTALQGESIDTFTTFALPRIFTEFLGGCVLYRLAQDGFGRSLPRWSLPAVLLGILILSQLSRNFEFLLLPLIGLVIVTLYHGGGIGERIFSNRATVYLGEISYSMYLLHPFAQIAGDTILKNTLFKNTFLKDTSAIISITDSYLILGAELLAVIALAIVGYHLVEKPARRFIIDSYLRKTNLPLRPTNIQNETRGQLTRHS